MTNAIFEFAIHFATERILWLFLREIGFVIFVLKTRPAFIKLLIVFKAQKLRKSKRSIKASLLTKDWGLI